ncbi:MAG TPA: CRISPR system precrRNA processing endoribonuclease RAMP protein Cas6 [Nitrospiraceae bacterium]|nr:CRISPR system precrRNA processing endoribonuclease RAMP protein Cas6 [Nitrospiraceae bacterium]
MSGLPTDANPGRTSLPLSFGRFTIALKPDAALRLPLYAGSMFRGAFGLALKRVVCATHTYECVPCGLKDRCIYPYVFETPPPPDTRVMRKYPAAPHPFVLEPPAGGQTVAPGEAFELGLTLFGRALRWLPHFIFTFERMGRIGFGSRRVTATVTEANGWVDGRCCRIYSAKEGILAGTEACMQTARLSLHPPVGGADGRAKARMEIEFLTPVRVKYDERLAMSLEFHILVRALLRRIAHLSYFHCGGDPSEVAFREWINLARSVQTVSSALVWYDWTRYSQRQQETMQLGGLIGRVTFEGPLGPFVPLLRVGEVTHVGKATSFGLGQYRLLGAGLR